jgi:hypothetical protein
MAWMGTDSETWPLPTQRFSYKAALTENKKWSKIDREQKEKEERERERERVRCFKGRYRKS